MLLPGVFLVIAVAALSFGLSWLVLRNARQLGVIATPNERSSHAVPTPSGGGIGIVAGGTLASLVVAWFAPWPTSVVLLAGIAMAAVGFYDDRKPIPATYRLGAQLLLASIMAALCIPAEALAAGIGLPLPSGLIVVLAVLATVYWINIFNFMDGIDGIAASEAAFMLGGAALLAALAIPGVTEKLEFWWLLASAASAAAFLGLNWPPAKIFMGDAGSTFLGFIIAFFALATIALGWLSLWQWLILGACFLTDSTVTLIRRLRLRERLFEAHRRHAYQRLSRYLKSHQKVTLGVIAINVFWLLPLAVLAGPGAGFPILVVVLAYAPLIILAVRAGAGLPEERPAL